MDALLTNALEFFQWLISLPKQGYTNLLRNSVHMWDDMSALNYIRMIAIVGGYLFLRPYLHKWGERNQAKQHEKVVAETESAKKQGRVEAKISPNALRGGKSVSSKQEEEEEEDEGGNGEEWGKRAKRRQKKVQEILEKAKAEELDEVEDKDIMEYLVDYEEGKDGW